MSKYANPDYWEERYRSNDTTFDWYLTFDNLEPVLRPMLQPAEQIHVLVVGCGNSRLSPCMYEHLNVRKITNVDVSPTVISQMTRRYKGMDEMRWICCDLIHTAPDKLLTLLCPEDALFDFVIDKGLVDATLGGSNSFHNLYTLTKNLARVMKNGGRFLSVSYGAPETRIDHFRRRKLNFDVEHRTIEKSVFASGAAPTGSYHVYIMTKLGERQAVTAGAADDGALSGDTDDDDDFYDRFMTKANTTSADAARFD
ncbi:methyltransferase domain containing protein, putative [Trypanosoma equiperdum]|uniref:Methyltransferase domain-containing protein n=3 Tax=Trypanozoon TaxID=39700 RepID=Q57XQ9_TRYB2|nr:hypothetical protein, conserved [Trypanosoma brucei brucei TREU927]AAX69609.1 hypothetical protein, conserved [Trypanosoma brucei]AAZ12750.1 hypothetical protein, conserved [Trypanosoma brucei brucei TREU927]RHW71181.1 methyltransferase domain containing protein [Trypanosoma brucei equiperdum]SCU64514.1 methyltransferase domain containing protein, putative [Trypanosoma equiperdum]